MENLIHFISTPFAWVLLVILFVVVLLFRMAYVAQTKELSVKYAKIVLKKYKDSKAKTVRPMYDYLFYAILGEFPGWNDKKVHKLKNRILNQWFKALSKEESAFLKNKWKMPRKEFINKCILWFPANDKNTRIYFLKKVISKNSK